MEKNFSPMPDQEELNDPFGSVSEKKTETTSSSTSVRRMALFIFAPLVIGVLLVVFIYVAMSNNQPSAVLTDVVPVEEVSPTDFSDEEMINYEMIDGELVFVPVEKPPVSASAEFVENDPADYTIEKEDIGSDSANAGVGTTGATTRDPQEPTDALTPVIDFSAEENITFN